MSGIPHLFREVLNGPPRSIPPELVNDALCKHFKAIVAPRREHHDHFRRGMESLRDRYIPETDTASQWAGVMARITPMDIKLTARQMKVRTAVGPDDVSLRVLLDLCANDNFAACLAEAFTQVLIRGTIPEEWRSSWWILIPKVEVPKSVKDFRSIAVTNCVYRLFMKIIQRRMVRVLEETHCLQGSQFGFRRGRSSTSST